MAQWPLFVSKCRCKSVDRMSANAAFTSLTVSPMKYDAVRSIESLSAAASSIPGFGFRQAQASAWAACHS